MYTFGSIGDYGVPKSVKSAHSVTKILGVRDGGSEEAGDLVAHRNRHRLAGVHDGAYLEDEE